MRVIAGFVFLSAFSLSVAETLTAEVNKVAYDYAVAVFEAAAVTVAECAPEQKARRGFYYLCGTTSLESEAFEAAWTPASAAYGATDEAGAAITADAWGATGAGNQGLPVYVDGEFIIGQYSLGGEVAVQSAQAYWRSRQAGLAGGLTPARPARHNRDLTARPCASVTSSRATEGPGPMTLQQPAFIQAGAPSSQHMGHDGPAGQMRRVHPLLSHHLRGGPMPTRHTPRISVELVPRSPEALHAELDTLSTHFPFVDTVNIPDLTRFSLRSYHACKRSQERVRRAIPHLRAVGTSLRDLNPLLTFLDEAELHEVLVVTGDLPADMSQPTYPTTSVQLIRAIKAALPHLTVYAALDPYRHSLVRERDYAFEKLEAGAGGLFTQPFFDTRLMQVYFELLPGVNLYWGATTVTSQRSLSYWQNRNHAVFPAHFRPTLTWSRSFAAEALTFAQETGTNLYFMPIKTDLRAFLEGIVTAETCRPVVPI